jgi:flavin-dependent dehydrogenase
MDMHSKVKSLTIVGGGLAGLTLGIGLRQKKVPVTVWESGHYPRHRVCGEFISGRGQETLNNLGLSSWILNAGTIPARTAMFVFRSAQTPVRTLPEPALSISRYVLDALLARIFQDLGGELRTDQRWPEEDFGEGVVRATGRRARQKTDHWRWFGTKFHARNVSLEADLEMHASRDAYVGISRLSGREVNVCGLLRSAHGSQSSTGNWKDRLCGAEGTTLHERLANADVVDGSFCSVAGLELAPHEAAAREECCVGDALTMIPPVTGNGMSMALEAAELAIKPLAGYSRGDCSWLEARQKLAHDCDVAFKNRLAWARWLQWMMFTPLLRTRFATLILGSEHFWRLFFTHTR